MCSGLQFTSASLFVSSGCELSLQCVTLSLAKEELVLRHAILGNDRLAWFP